MARRPARTAKAFQRGKAERAPRELVLIVCEGEKTEKNYLRSFCNDLQLSGASVTITPSHRGSDPVSVVTYAIDRFKEDGSIYARVYCVFDRDTHANFDEAMAYAASAALAKKGVLHTALSVPCFEFWVLLHYAYSSAPFSASGGRSPCDNVIEAMKRHIGDYKKSMEGLYAYLKPLTDQALAHADRIEAENRLSDSNNPSTDMHKLVRYLRELAEKG
jgi:hypothetical protein